MTEEIKEILLQQMFDYYFVYYGLLDGTLQRTFIN